MTPDARLARLEALTASHTQELQAHREGLNQLGQVVPILNALGQELAELVSVSGLPTSRALAAGFEPGGRETAAGQIVLVQETLEAFTVQLAAFDATLQVMLRAGKSREAWSPSRLDREIKQAQAAAVARVQALAARPQEEVEVVPRKNGVALDLSALTTDENADG